MASLYWSDFSQHFFFKILNEYKSNTFLPIEIHCVSSDNSNFRIKHIDKKKAIYSEEIK